jgi:hypothetical protein
MSDGSTSDDLEVALSVANTLRSENDLLRESYDMVGVINPHDFVGLTCIAVLDYMHRFSTRITATS